MIPFDDALRRVLDGVGGLPGETVPLTEASGRVLAQDVLARHDQPPAAISAMDGYAVTAEDARVGAVLTVIGEAPAGQPFGRSLGSGDAVRIATGGVVPAGASRIVIQEHAVRNGARLRIEALSDASFVRPAGGDFAAGQKLVEAGSLLIPARIGLIAAAGYADVRVARLPRVAVLASGDELREPGDALGGGAIFNSAAYAVCALVEQWGGTAVRHAVLPDDRAALDAALVAADLDVDVVVPLGGASVGDRDALRPAFEALGARIAFDKVAVIPGKPCWHARFADGRLLVGLPGNPASAFVCAHLFLRPLLERLMGRQSQGIQIGVLASDLGANGPREAWLRGRVTNVDSVVQVIVDPRQDSSLQTPLAAANALVRRTISAPPAEVGERVEYLSIAGM